MRSSWRTFITVAAVLAATQLVRGCLPPAEPERTPARGAAYAIVPANQKVLSYAVVPDSGEPRLGGRCQIVFGGIVQSIGRGTKPDGKPDKNGTRVRYTLPAQGLIRVPRTGGALESAPANVPIVYPDVHVVLRDEPNVSSVPGKPVPTADGMCASGSEFDLKNTEFKTFRSKYGTMAKRYIAQREEVARLLDDNGKLRSTEPTGPGERISVDEVEVMSLVPVRDTSVTNDSTSYGFWARCKTKPGARMHQVGTVAGQPLYRYTQSSRPGPECPHGVLFKHPSKKSPTVDLTYLYN